MVECGGLENHCTARYRGFESLSLRIKKPNFKVGLFNLPFKVYIYSLENEIDSLETVISNLEEEKSALIANHALVIQNLEQDHAIEVSDLQDDVNELEEDLEIADTIQLNSLINQLNDAAEINSSLISQLNAAVEIDALLIDSLITANLNLSDELDSCRIESENCVSDPIMVDLASGWNMIGFTLHEEQDVVASFDGISDKLEIVKDNYGDVYLVEWDYNGIVNLIPGQGYQIRMEEAVDEFYSE